MHYKQFLISQLLRDMIEIYNEMAYDILWDLSFIIIKDYETKENLEVDMYSDIVDYIEKNKLLLKTLAKNKV
jgi:hypothetical protein